MKCLDDMRYACDYYKRRITDYIEFNNELVSVMNITFDEKIIKYRKELEEQLDEKLDY